MVNGELVRRYGSMKAHRVARRVTLAEGEALAKKLGAAFVESSARDNKNVGESASSASRAALWLIPSLGKAFEILLREMQKEYNPAPEKKKASWWGWAR